MLQLLLMTQNNTSTTDLFYGKIKRVHFVGVGGIGMSGIAEVLANLSLEVTGSDVNISDNVHRIRNAGVEVFLGHESFHVHNSDAVVYSSAIRPDNPEIVEAKKLNIPVIPRAQMLAELMRFKHGIAIAGSHGKTTTTSLVSHILQAAELDPTVVIGGKVNQMGSNAKLGEGKYMVAEADESDGSFLCLTPSIMAITNIDLEHVDFYTDGIISIRNTFKEFANKLPFYGLCVVCADDTNIQIILPHIKKRIATYSIEGDADYCATEIAQCENTVGFQVEKHGEQIGFVRMRMVGRHNVANALAAIAIADELGVSMDIIQRALASFRGVQRRFTLIGESNGIRVIDDYAHHPTEIRAILKAAKESYPNNRILAFFQPHRFSRTQQLEKDFASCFEDAHHAVLTDIYAASEDPIDGVNSPSLCKKIQACSKCFATYGGELMDAARKVGQMAEPGDIILTLGAGNITKAGAEILKMISLRRTQQ